MLILSRREAECICLGDDIVLTIVAVGNDKVRIGVKAPPGIRILRQELEVHDQILPIPAPIGKEKGTDAKGPAAPSGLAAFRRKAA